MTKNLAFFGRAVRVILAFIGNNTPDIVRAYQFQLLLGVTGQVLAKGDGENASQILGVRGIKPVRSKARDQPGIPSDWRVLLGF